MPAKAAIASVAHDNRMVLLAWAPPLLALCLLAGVGVVRRTERLSLETAPAAAVEASALAGAGNALLSHANFH